MQDPDIFREERLPLAQLFKSGMNPLNRRELLLAASGSAAALLFSGCGGGSSSSSSKSIHLAPFTVTPNLAAPGTMVTLTGINAINGASIDVRFGNVPAIVYAQDSTGLQVLVPPFIASGSAVSTPPATPMPVTIQVGKQMAKSTNQFTVAPLSASPGMSKAVISSISDMASFFQGFLQEGIIPLLYDPTDPASSPLDAAPAIQGAAFCAAAAGFYSGDNPNSLQSTLNNLASQGAAGASTVALIDAMLAQGPQAAIMQDFAQATISAITAIAPDAIVSRAVSSSSGRIILPPNAFAGHRVNWAKVDAAQRIIIELQMQKYLSIVTNSATSNIVQMLFSTGMMILQVMALATSGPLAPASISVASLAVDLGIKLLSVIASTMPGQISDFYVILNNNTRHTGDPAVNIPITVNTPLRMQIVTQSTGGLAFSALGTAGVVSALAEKFVPGLKPLLEGNPGVIKALSDLMLSLGDGIWQLASGGPPPALWSASDTFNFPPHKYKPVDINDSRVVTVISNSTALLTVGVDSNHTYFLKGIHEGGNTGYHCWISKQALIAGFPSLADIAGEKWNVLGVVNIAGGAVQLGIS